MYLCLYLHLLYFDCDSALFANIYFENIPDY